MQSILLDRIYDARSTLIETNCENVYEYLNEYYGHIVSQKMDKKYDEITIVEKRKGKFVLKYYNKTVETSYPLSELNTLLHCKEMSPDYFVLHAGGTEYRNKLMLFPASSNSGKSTLVMYLVQNKYQYISDDEIIIDLKKKKIVNKYKPIFLRNDITNLFGLDKCIDYERFEIGKESDHIRKIVNVYEYTVREIKNEIDYIFFTKYGEKNDISEIMDKELLTKKLLISSLRKVSITPDVSDFIFRLANKRAYFISYNDLDYVRDNIDNLVESGM